MMNKCSGNNFKLYKASAGSGKTYTLVKEFLTLCLSSDNSFSYKGILAVTFTNKAANEMKAKILSNLDGIINKDPDYMSMRKDVLNIIKIDEDVLEERAKRLYDDILHNYSDLNVSTIDSFIQQVSRSFAKELNLPSQYKVILDSDDLFDDLIQRIDAKIGKDDKFVTYILSRFLKYNLSEENTWHLDAPIKDFLEKLIKESAYKKGESINAESIDESQYEEIEKYLDDKISHYKNLINVNIENIDVFNNENSLSFDDYNKVLPSFLNKIKKDINIEPKNLINKTLNDILYEGKNWNKNKKISVSEPQSLQLITYFTNILESHSSLYLINIVKKNLYLYVLRGTLTNIINQYIEETNKVHISEFNKRISDVIDDCSVPFIYERIGSRYKHFFIDEFQDTSVLQWFNFLPLINNSLSEGFSNLLVGDAKQAIYRFRSGEVEQIIKLPQIYKKRDSDFFLECESNFNNQFVEYSLDTNYRSKKNIINFNNSFFRKAKSQLTHKDYESVYTDNMEQKYMYKSGDYEGYVKTEIFKTENFIEEGKKRHSTKKIKEAINNAMLNDINILKEKGFSYSDITILVRSNTDGSLIADFLAKNNVPVISSESILLKSSDKVQLIILALKHLVDADNDVVRLSLAFYQNLLKSKTNDEDSSLLKDALNTDIDEDYFTELRSKSLSIYDLCFGIMKMYEMSPVDDVFLQYFMNTVHDWQCSENGDIKSFLDFWEKKSGALFVKISGKMDAVQIMSIHKSKGLEFKVVMYPYATTKIPDFHPNEEWLSFKEDFKLLEDMPHLENFILPVKSGLIGTSLESHYNDEYDKAAFDDINVMYVAMTRPEELLFIYTDDETSKDNQNNFFVDYFSQNNIESNGDVLDFVYDECDDRDVYSLGEINYINKEKDKSDTKELRSEEGEEYFTIDWLQKLRIEPDATMFWKKDDDLNPREWGILVHEIFSKINTIDDAPLILKRYVNDGYIDQANADNLMTQFVEVVGRDEIREAYSPEAVVKNEMDILDREGNIMRPDRYVELKDKVMLIDYKTGAPDEKYYEQLKRYMLALKEMIPHKNIEAYLVYMGKETKVEQVFLDRLF
ncbi:MAG: UvrD-helicase domain-containing protein [Bacteroidales bacterium]|nr:UvrD-helicase domain-containing protein [Bacteroidales bacterium]